MTMTITFRHLDATEAVKNHATDKIGKVQRFLRNPMTAHITLSKDGERNFSAEVDVHAAAQRFLARESGEDLYACLDKVVDKLERQIVSEKADNKGQERASQRLLPDVAEED